MSALSETNTFWCVRKGPAFALEWQWHRDDPPQAATGMSYPSPASLSQSQQLRGPWCHFHVSGEAIYLTLIDACATLVPHFFWDPSTPTHLVMDNVCE